MGRFADFRYLVGAKVDGLNRVGGEFDSPRQSSYSMHMHQLRGQGHQSDTGQQPQHLHARG